MDGQLIPDLALFINPLGGYICGNSIYKIRTKAQKFYYENGVLKQVAFLIRKKTQAVFPGVIRAGVYNVDPMTGAPDSLLAHSSFFPVGNIKSFINVDSADNHTIVTFQDSVQLPDTFFVGLDLTFLAPGDSSQGITGDTIGLWSTREGCFSGEQLAWEEDSAGVWHPFNDGTTSSSWGLDIDMAIFPIGNFVSDTIIDGIVQKELVTVNVYPNPADDYVVFKGDWRQAESQIDLFGIDGETVLTKTVQWDDSGSFILQTGHLPSGIYLFEISVENDLNRISGKLMIEK